MSDTQKHKKPNVPNLRFSEFSGEWERNTIIDVCRITTGNKNTQDKDDEGLYPFYVRSPKIEHINSWTFEGEAILTAGDGVGVGKVFHYSTGKIGVHQRVYILSDFKCNGKYLYYYFSSRFYDRVKHMSAKNSVDSVRMEMIADMPLSLPIRKEQDKISSLLSLIDERITIQNKVIEKYESLIKALRRRVFSSLNTVNEVKISDVLSYEQPTKYLVTDTEYLNDKSLTPVLTANKGFILGYTDELKGIYDKGPCIIFDDFTMDCKIVYFPFKVKSSAIKILKTKTSVNLRFIYEYIKYLDLRTEEHKRHYIAEIEPMMIEMPDLNQVVKISKLFDALDLRIREAEQELQLLKAEKTFYLNTLFI